MMNTKVPLRFSSKITENILRNQGEFVNLFQYHHSSDLVELGSGGKRVGLEPAEVDAGTEAVCMELPGVVSRCEDFTGYDFDSST